MWFFFLCCCCCCLVLPAAGHEARSRLPFFHGHVFENSPAASRVNGLSVPARRINAQEWCSASGAHFKLYGNGSEDFRAFAHHRRGNILLKTSRPLDRETRASYLLSVAMCCRSCVSGAAALEVASVRVDVLDTNDNAPAFVGSRTLRLTVDDTTPLRSSVWRLAAVDADGGNNAEVTYVSAPRNGSFYVVPKTGEILLVDSILGLPSEVTFSVFARDHGWPPLTSDGVLVTVAPRRWPSSAAAPPGGRGRSPRALLDPGAVLSLNVSEDLHVGALVASLAPSSRFHSATYELIFPEPEMSPVVVDRESGDVTLTRRLDRETEPLVELTVKIQDRRGESGRCWSICTRVTGESALWQWCPILLLHMVSAPSGGASHLQPPPFQGPKLTSEEPGLWVQIPLKSRLSLCPG